jgi:Zinc knuckle
VVTLKNGGITLKDQELASTNFHNLKMNKSESITSYAIRAEGLVEAMAHSGIKDTHLPTPAAQAMKFINGLDVTIESYLQLTAHCENSLSVFGADVYPATLPDALRFASKFKQMTISKAATPETEIAPTVLTSLMARHETGGKKKPGKADSGGGPSVPKPPPDEDDHSWKKKIICRTCGAKGHIEKECPEKAAFQEFLAQKKVHSVNTAHYTTFGNLAILNA